MNTVERALYQALSSSPEVMSQATEVCYGAGTLDTEFPFVVFFKQPGSRGDVYSFSSRVGRLLHYAVKAVDIGPSKQRAQEIADAIDSVLTDSALDLDDWEWLHCHRTGDIEYPETLLDGQVVWHIGGIYEIAVAIEGV